MDTVKFDIALARYPPRKSPTPLSASATVPSVTGDVADASRVEAPSPKSNSSLLKVPAAGSGIASPIHFGPPTDPKPPTDQASGVKLSLADRFHDWMEMDLEHGL